MIEKINAVVCENAELQYRDMYILIAVLPFLTNQESIFDVKKKLMIIRKEHFSSNEKLSIGSLIEN